MNSIEQKLADLQIILPDVPSAIANYIPFSLVPVSANEAMIFISGQLPMSQGQIVFQGKIGKDLTIEEGQKAARLCGINLLAQLKAACAGDLTKVQKCIRLGGFVQSTDSFQDQPKVVNGASDLMVQAFGDEGRHARAAVGVNTLPLGAAVEVEGLFLIRTV